MIPPISKCENGVNNSDAVGKSTIESIQKQRGSVYGKFSEQCECVGKIIDALSSCSMNNGVAPTYKQLGAFANMAVNMRIRWLIWKATVT
jgi:hypothetical protein